MAIQFLLTACLLLLQLLSYAQQPKLPSCKHKMVVVAHRGDHTEAPENTLQAFQNAIKNQADYVEIDLRTTLDSQLVIMHDRTINRMTNGSGNVANLNAAQISQFKVSDKNHPEWVAQFIPMFEEVLKLCKNNINIYLDFKEADVKTTYEALQKAGMENQVVVYINAAHQFLEWRKIAPQIPLIVSMPDTIKTPQQLKHFLEQYKPTVLDGSYTEYTPEMVKVATENGVPIWADIQQPDEAPKIWDKGIVLGLAGLQTDHPSALINYLKSKYLR